MQRTLLVLLVALANSPLTARAQSSPFADPDVGARPPRWGVIANLGSGAAKGDFSSLLERPISGELNVFRTEGAWRFGLGVSLGSFTMRPPYTNSLEWGFQQDYLSATRMLYTKGAIHPYLQVRGGLARLHPRSHLFDQRPLPEGFALGDSATVAANGWSV